MLSRPKVKKMQYPISYAYYHNGRFEDNVLMSTNDKNKEIIFNPGTRRWVLRSGEAGRHVALKYACKHITTSATEEEKLEFEKDTGRYTIITWKGERVQ